MPTAVNTQKEDESQSREPGQGGRIVPADRQTANVAEVDQKNFRSSDARKLRKLVDSNHPELRVSPQCELLALPRCTHYYQQTPDQNAIRSSLPGPYALPGGSL